MRRLVFAVSLILVAPSALARSASTTRPSVEAIRIPEEESPRIDGDLSEPVWARAVVVDSFLQRDPQEGMPASEKTEVRILYTGKAVYLGVTCYDSEPGLIRATELRRDDRLENDDRFSVLFDTFHDRRNAYLFRTNPLGTKFDAQISDEKRDFNTQWDEKWNSAARVNGKGWIAEIKIPFKTLRSGTQKSQTWGLNFERVIVRKNEKVYWAGYSRDYEFRNVSQAGDLTHLKEVRTGLRLRVKPFVLGGFSQFSNEGGGRRLENESQVGLEVVKASITPSITADFTVNPDFAQAEVDEARFNLTRFSLFFPERREFFLERAGIFDFGTRRPSFNRPPEVLAFFSRRIGLEDGQQIPISTGARLTGDSGGFQFGFLNVLTRGKGDFPGDNSTVVRIKRKLLERSYIGGIFTQDRLSGRSHDLRRLGGLDANFVLFDKLRASGYWARSQSPSKPGGNTSYNATVSWESDLLDLTAERTRVDVGFDAPLGFVRRREIVKNRGRVVWKPRPKSQWIRQFRISSEHVWFTNQRDFLESRENDIFFGATFESGDFIGASFNSKYEALEEDFDVHPDVVIPAGSYHFSDIVVFARAYPGRSISGSFRVQQGGFFGGRLLSTSAGPLIKLTESLSVGLNHTLSKATLPGGNFTAQVINTRVNYNLTNRLLTSTTVQYNNVDNEFLVNWRLNYIYRPGDDLFIVYNEGRDFNSGTPGLINRTILVKFTHSFDF
ncbi:MAG: DUF5916 domain-containing protein [Acidobacteriota bacterium]